MQLSEARTALATKLDIDYTTISQNGLWTAGDLDILINDACRLAWHLHAWPFKEEVMTLNITADNITDQYMDYPDQISSDSIFFLMIAGKEWKKLDWQSYRKYKENYTSGEEKVFADIKRFIHFNVNAVAVGDAVDLTGHINFTALSTGTDILPFSPNTDNQEDTGNDAIIQLAYAAALASKKLNNKKQGQIERAEAIDILNRVWEPIAIRQASYQSKDRPMFDVPDFFSTAGRRRTRRATFEDAI